VLVVEDDLSARILVALLLEHAGCSPTAVPTVGRALERLDDEGADLVLTDLNLSGESGLDLMLRLRERGSATPVVAMSGSEDAELIARAFRLGAKTVLHKPFSAAWLRAAVEAALDRVANERERAA
jgi:DNA-binding response OmpR family regulator